MGREGMFDAEDDADETINGLFGDLEGDEDEPGFSMTGADDMALDTRGCHVLISQHKDG